MSSMPSKRQNTSRLRGLSLYNNFATDCAGDVSEDSEWRPWLIPVFVLASMVVFVVTMYVNNCPMNNSRAFGDCVAKPLGALAFQPLRENPLFGPSSSTLVKMGALDWSKIVHQKQGWRLITSIWLHAGVVHMLLNLSCLTLLGVCLEQRFGFARVGIIYLLSGFSGSILSSFFIEGRVSAGASGALFGLVGAMLSEIMANWTVYTNKAPTILKLLCIMAVNLAIGILPHVDNFTHIGGLISGLLLGLVILVPPQYAWLRRYFPVNSPVKFKRNTFRNALRLVAMSLFMIGMVAALAMLFKGKTGNENCSWCHYLSCVPTSKWQC
ncbi:hypothetical protein MLD38_039119 [Melastoma candidum]|uniref:Uncharacterized protein n=1 Tax=Melastoma candidum TaxID=119954 RepID=A0ACB9L138_9MYRT|nr:hypothetical protein MLD38_039119 [Melastoma candidum]